MWISSGETAMTLSVRILRVLATSGEEARAPQHSQVYVCFAVGVALSLQMGTGTQRWWDPISPIRITNHVRHLSNTFAMLWDDSCSRMTKDDKKATLCDHLRCLIPFYDTLQCSLSLLQPFLTFSDAFRPFVTFLDFALFNTPPDCVAFSGMFHQTFSHD